MKVRLKMSLFISTTMNSFGATKICLVSFIFATSPFLANHWLHPYPSCTNFDGLADFSKASPKIWMVFHQMLRIKAKYFLTQTGFQQGSLPDTEIYETHFRTSGNKMGCFRFSWRRTRVKIKLNIPNCTAPIRRASMKEWP